MLNQDIKAFRTEGFSRELSEGDSSLTLRDRPARAMLQLRCEIEMRDGGGESFKF